MPLNGVNGAGPARADPASDRTWSQWTYPDAASCVRGSCLICTLRRFLAGVRIATWAALYRSWPPKGAMRTTTDRASQQWFGVDTAATMGTSTWNGIGVTVRLSVVVSASFTERDRDKSD